MVARIGIKVANSYFGTYQNIIFNKRNEKILTTGYSHINMTRINDKQLSNIFVITFQ